MQITPDISKIWKTVQRDLISIFNVLLGSAIAIPYISLFNLQQTDTVDLIFFSLSCILLSNVHFHTVLSIFPFLFNRSQSKAGVVNQMTHPCFRKKLVLGQLNVQAATAGKEK